MADNPYTLQCALKCD